MPPRKTAEPAEVGQLAGDIDGFAGVYVLWTGSLHVDVQHSPIGGPYIAVEVCSCKALVIQGQMPDHLAVVKHG